MIEKIISLSNPPIGAGYFLGECYSVKWHKDGNIIAIMVRYPSGNCWVTHFPPNYNEDSVGDYRDVEEYIDVLLTLEGL